MICYACMGGSGMICMYVWVCAWVCVDFVSVCVRACVCACVCALLPRRQMHLSAACASAVRMFGCMSVHLRKFVLICYHRPIATVARQSQSLFAKNIECDTEGMRTPAGRAKRISSPSPQPLGHSVLVNVQHWPIICNTVSHRFPVCCRPGRI